MKKITFSLLFLLSGCKENSSSKKEVLTIGMSVDYAPYEFYQDGKIVGFDVDFAKEIGKRLKKEVVFQDMGFEGLVASLQTKHVDMVVSCFSHTPERALKVDFSKNYYQNRNQLVLQKKSPIKSMQDLKALGVQAGSTHESFAKDWQKNNSTMQIRSLSKIPDLIQELKTGRIEALLLGNTEANRIIKSQKEFKIVDINQKSEGYAIAFPKNSLLKKKVDPIIDDMEKDGTLQKLKEKWLNE